MSALPGRLNFQGRSVLLKYHRLLSGSHNHPPNSRAALLSVLEGGAEVIEFDVGMRSDGGFALLHDPRLDRETTGVGLLEQADAAMLRSICLRGSDERVVLLEDAVSILACARRPAKVQVDLKELLPLGPEQGMALIRAMEPLRANRHLRVVVGCLADWNLRLLRRLDPSLYVGVDPACYLDVAVDGSYDLPTEILANLPHRLNAYGYLDDHPLGYRRLLPVEAYLRDRLEVLIQAVPQAVEFYLRKEFVLRALSDGLNPIAFIQEQRPGATVDVWTLNASDPGGRDLLLQLLAAGAGQITTDTAVQLAAFIPQ